MEIQKFGKLMVKKESREGTRIPQLSSVLDQVGYTDREESVHRSVEICLDRFIEFQRDASMCHERIP